MSSNTFKNTRQNINLGAKHSVKNYKTVLLQHSLWLTWALTLFIFCLGGSWQINKSVNFSYAFWYQHLEINKTIANNVVNNIHGKRDFPIHDANLHQEKFADIVSAIHQHGKGLNAISYQNSKGQHRQLLTASEVQHLQDVANLLDKVIKVWWGSSLLLCLLLNIYYRYCSTKSHSTNKVTVKSIVSNAITIIIPSVKQKLVSVLALCLLTSAILSLWGFTGLFYYLHTVVFPVGHQWFFYYYESLMSTIMKAPEIFAAIAGQLAIVALCLAMIIDGVATRFIRRRY